MPQTKISNIRIRGVTTCVGSEKRSLEALADLYSADPSQLQRMRKIMQLESRQCAPEGVTTLDLCEAAARYLLSKLAVDATDIDAIVCVTQTPDHWQPCNANLLHGRLGLLKSAAAFDVNQGCSGWVYGFYLVSTMLASGGCRKVLLLAGDTISHCIHPSDRATLPLFGDAGSATLVEYDLEWEKPVWFSLHSDGKGAAAIQIPGGAFRNPGSVQTSPEVTDSEGNVRTACHLHMNGLEVFNFTLREEPAAVRSILEFAGVELDSIDYFVMHQANAFILQNLAKRLKVPPEKMPWDTAGRYGNQSSASIPGTLCDSPLATVLQSESPLVLCSGFGVGLSWGSCILNLGPLPVCEVLVYGSRD